MKRTMLVFISGFFAIVLISCTLPINVFDDAIPKERTSTILFANLNVYTYNGISVSGKGWDYSGALVNVPAGRSSFTTDSFFYVVENGQRVRYNVRNAEFTFNLEPGKEYTFLSATMDGRLGVVVYDTIKKAIPMDGKYSGNIGFIPFVQ